MTDEFESEVLEPPRVHRSESATDEEGPPGGYNSVAECMAEGCWALVDAVRVYWASRRAWGQA